MSTDIQRIIHGKAGIKHVVGMKVEEDVANIWTEKDGVVEHLQLKNKFWLLSNKRIAPNWTKLEGNLYYQYGAQFSKRLDFTRAKYQLSKYDCYSIMNPEESFMVKDGVRYFLDLKPKEVSILSFDIETTGLSVNENSKLLLISNTYRCGDRIVKKMFDYTDYESCGAMTEAWCDWVREMNPAIICGHNIIQFDLKYLLDCANRDGTRFAIGRDDRETTLDSYTTKFRVDGSRSQEINRYVIFGRELCDTMLLALRYDIATKKYDSYGLKQIIKTEKLEKVDRQFYDASLIRVNYKNPTEWAKIREYCKDDADDALALFDLMIPSAFYCAQSIPKTFGNTLTSATGGQINSMLVGAYLQDKHSIPKTTETNGYEGALSGGNPGIYSHAIKADVQSLYPSIMRNYKIGLGNKDPKGVFIQLTEYFTVERLKNKKLAKETGDKYYDDLQSSQKVFANSLYGFCAAPGLSFNAPQSASFITKTGRDILLKAIQFTCGLTSEQLQSDVEEEEPVDAC